MTTTLSCSFPVEQQPKYPDPKAEKNANYYFPNCMGNTKRTKGELHPCVEGLKISIRRLSLSQNDSVNKVNSKFLIRGKKNNSYLVS